MSDKELIERLQLGDNCAFLQVYEAYYPMAIKHVRDNSGKEEDAKDLFQEALIALIKMINKPSFKLTAKLSTLMHSIIKNQWLYKLRSKKQKQTIFLDESDSLENIADTIHAEDQYEQKHFIMQSVLQEMKEDCKKVLSAFYFSKASLKDIAVMMGFSENFAKQKKHRCMKKFKEMIQEHPDFENLKN